MFILVQPHDECSPTTIAMIPVTMNDDLCAYDDGGGHVITSPPDGVAIYCFHCVCLCVCPANILVFYFSAIRRDIDRTFMQDTYRFVLHRWKVKVTGMVHRFLKVQSYHKN